MAMRNPRITIFGSAIAALALMTVLSAAMGLTLPNLLSPAYTRIASILLFCFFGVRLLYDAYHMDAADDKKEELEEVEQELAGDPSPEGLEMGMGHGGGAPANSEQGESKEKKPGQSAFQASMQTWARRFFTPVFIQCFTMTFLAEWGDRSQISTIALAASKDPIGVTIGGIIGHAICTGLAVMGGKLLATRISEKMVSIVGGILFLLFAIHGTYSKE